MSQPPLTDEQLKVIVARLQRMSDDELFEITYGVKTENSWLRKIFRVLNPHYTPPLVSILTAHEAAYIMPLIDAEMIRRDFQKALGNVTGAKA